MSSTSKYVDTVPPKVEDLAAEPPPRLARGTHERITLDPEEAVAPASRWDEHVADIVHDLRHPVHNIAIEMAVMERQLGATHANQEGIARVRENLAYMERVIVELLESAAAEHVVLRLVPTELCSLLQRVMERVGAAEDRERVRIEASHSVVAHVDAHHIERVISNLLQNALAYAPAPAKIVMRIERRANVVKLSVIDHGIGISSTDASWVFEKYTRGASSSDRDGSGIGLYVCRKIVEAHGGRIALRSTLGRGSRFVIELPV
ncbi:MAG: HAMP domain-containing histidine kinase [Deltaproteobacteria bacterium]|nr:HAMP domain-containing histidine kinase [Deltaproteobacteria bacterium]